MRSWGVSIDKLLPFNLAVNEEAQTNNLSVSAAAYSVIEEIENYNRIGGLKNEISRLAAQIYAMNRISARQNNALMALMRLQASGITDDDILNVSEFLNRARLENTARIHPSMS
jgi:hypothetical protein